MDVTRSTLGADSSGYEVSHDGETYRFETVGESAVRLVDADTLPSEVAAEIQSLGFGTIEVNEDFHIRTDDPDDAHVGMRWYRSDRGTVRQQVPGGVIDERAVYDVPSTTLLEDFEGKTVEELTTQAAQGTPSFAVVERNGSDQLEIESGGGDFGFISLDSDSFGFEVHAEKDSSEDGTALVFYGQPNSENSLIANVSYGGIDLNWYDDSGSQQPVDSVSSLNSGELDTFTMILYGMPNGVINLVVETESNTYELSGSVGDVDLSSGLNVGYGTSSGASTGYYDVVSEYEDKGELSTNLSYTPEGDQNLAISESPPLDTSKIWLDERSSQVKKYDEGSGSWVDVTFGDSINPASISLDEEGGEIGITATPDSLMFEDSQGSINFFPNELRLNREQLFLGHSQDNDFIFEQRGGGITIRSDNGSTELRVSNDGVEVNGQAGITGKGADVYPPEDLSTRTGTGDGELAADDGTNTPVRGTLCLWDASNSVWRPQNNPDGGAF